MMIWIRLENSESEMLSDVAFAVEERDLYKKVIIY